MIFPIKNPDGTTSTINARNRNVIRNQSSFVHGFWMNIDGVEFGNGTAWSHSVVYNMDPDDYDDNYIELPLLSENQYYDRDTSPESRDWRSTGSYEIVGAGNIQIAYFTYTEIVEGQTVTKYYANIPTLYNNKYDYAVPAVNRARNNTSYTLSGARRPRISFDIITIKRSGFTPSPDDPETDCLLISIWYQVGDNLEISTQTFYSLSFLTGNSPVPTSDVPTGTSLGGLGSRINTSDKIDFPDIDAVNQASVIQSNTDAHGIHIYALSFADVSSLFDELWSLKITNLFKNNIFNPLQGIVAIHKMCCDQSGISVASNKMKLAGCTMSTTARHCSTQFVKTVFPAIEIPYYTRSFLDYAPFTSMSIHLPFIGIVPIDPSLVVGGRIQVCYIFDRIQGNCTATLKYFDKFGNEDIIGSYAGNCAYQSIISGNDNGFPAIRGAVSGAISTVSGFSSANTRASIVEDLTKQDAAKTTAKNSLIGSIIGGTWDVLTAPRTEKSAGSLASNAAALGCTDLYVMITYPQDVNMTDESGNYRENLYGVSAASGGKVSDYSGSLVAGIVHANIETATEQEKEEIETLVAKGVYV